MKQAVSNWVPAIFCAFLSLLALSMQLNSDSSAWKPAFYSFLPMCFFFVGIVTLQMQREIRELKSALADVQEKREG